ncbi:hypothetical protein BT93_D0936 [Corymbia citriodora subsp. variegata]|nr:hypothetical protein BT93_D0936 [Corymbia citriodora subsp. variegata]
MCFVNGPGQEGCPFLLEAEGQGQRSGRGGRRKWSLRHMSTLRSRSAVGLGDCALISTPNRREVVNWLNSILRVFEQSNRTFNSPLLCASFGKIRFCLSMLLFKRLSERDQFVVLASDGVRSI